MQIVPRGRLSSMSTSNSISNIFSFHTTSAQVYYFAITKNQALINVKSQWIVLETGFPPLDTFVKHVYLADQWSLFANLRVHR